MTSSHYQTLFGLLCAIALASCSGNGSGSHNLGPANNPQAAIGGKTLNGLPIGQWMCVFKADTDPTNSFTIKNIVSITPNGTGSTMNNYQLQYHGHHFASGKFQGRENIAWTTMGGYHSIKRVGDEIYFYEDPEPSRLTSSDPPGYTLRDFMTLGGALQKPINEMTEGEGGVCIMKIQGKDLILENSTDGNRWLFKHAKNTR